MDHHRPPLQQRAQALPVANVDNAFARHQHRKRARHKRHHADEKRIRRHQNGDHNRHQSLKLAPVGIDDNR